MSLVHKSTSMVLALAIGGAVFFSAPRASAQVGAPAGNPEAEIKELFKKVEKDLTDIEKLLNQATSDNAAAASAAAKEAAKSANTKQREVSESIQKIMDLIPPSGGGNCSNCSNHGLKKPGEDSQGSSSGQNPSQGAGNSKPQDQSQQQDEMTARGAGKAPTMPKGSESEGKEPKGGSNPDSPKKSNSEPSQGESKPREYATERANRSREGTERWGDLPEYAQRAFSNENTEDLPMRYRKWIQDFYLRMGKSGSGSAAGK